MSEKYKELVEWKGPLFRVLEGHEDLLQVTSEFPELGKLPPLGEIPAFEVVTDLIVPRGASAIVAIVVVVVCVAVAARPGALTSAELLRAKLLDVYTPKERRALRDAIAIVQKNPELVKSTLGIDPAELGPDFAGRLEQVQKVLSV